jgi:hypothetical protein
MRSCRWLAHRKVSLGASHGVPSPSRRGPSRPSCPLWLDTGCFGVLDTPSDLDVQADPPGSWLWCVLYGAAKRLAPPAEIMPACHRGSRLNGCYRPHGARGANLCGHVVGTLLTVSSADGCGKGSLPQPDRGDGAIHAGHKRYQMSYVHPTHRLPCPTHKVLTAPSLNPQADRRTHANKKLAGSISRTSRLQVFRHRATYMTSRVRYALVAVHSVRFVSTGSDEDHRSVKYYTLASCL